MAKAAKSVFVFGLYLALVGMLFLLIPQTLVSLLRLPDLPDGWARVIGLLVLIIATCDIISGRSNLTPLLRASVYIRFAFTLSVAVLVLLGQMPLPTLLFGIVDAAGAVWTATALKADGTNN